MTSGSNFASNYIEGSNYCDTGGGERLSTPLRVCVGVT
jgi:hypothetical protein